VLSSLRDDLAKAIELASKVDVWVSPQQAHERLGTPVSSIRRWCREEPEAIGAKRFKGSWKINWPVFHAYMCSNSPITEEAA
jgi:hypothetical protein